MLCRKLFSPIQLSTNFTSIRQSVLIYIFAAPQLEACQSRCGPLRRGMRPSPTATSPAPSTGWGLSPFQGGSMPITLLSKSKVPRHFDSAWAACVAAAVHCIKTMDESLKITLTLSHPQSIKHVKSPNFQNFLVPNWDPYVILSLSTASLVLALTTID